MGPLFNEMGALVTQEAPIKAAFVSVFTSKMGLQIPRSQRPGGRLEQGICTLGGRESGPGILEQTGCTYTHGS